MRVPHTHLVWENGEAIIYLLPPYVDQTLKITCENGKEYNEYIAIA